MDILLTNDDGIHAPGLWALYNRLAGVHRVEVVAYQTVSPTAIRWLVPKKYQKASTSGVTVTVQEPTDSLLIELSWEGGKPFVEEFETTGDVDPAEL